LNDAVRSEGFPPVANRESRVLVLGTLPGPESLRRRQYYAQPRNAFWRILGELVCFNGQTAATLYRRLVIPVLPLEFASIDQRVLPSTSPAHAALSFERKLERWREVRGPASAMLGAP